MAVVKANYVQVGSAGWGSRITAAMNYYAHRPGADLREEEETPAVGPPGAGRHFYTASGERISLAEAEARLFAQVEARRAAQQRQQEDAKVERKTARDAAFEARCERFVDGAGARRGMSRERRQQLVKQWRQTRHAKERKAAAELRVYRVVVSTDRTVLDGRDIRHVLEAADRRRSLPWMYVRHDTGSHPHVHALVLTEGRGLDKHDLTRMRETLGEREAVREREQTAVRQRTDGGRQR